MMDSATLFNYYVTPLKHRSAREIENKNASDANTNEQNSSSEIAKTDSESELSRLPVIIPATLTVVIFVACVICIAYQNYNIEEFPFTGSSPDIAEPTEQESCCPARRRKGNKTHGKHELYDVMLQQYKVDTHLRHPGRKSSAIHIEGLKGSDPQSIAQKHLILRRMRYPNKKASAVGALIKLSSTAFIASSMIEDGTELGHSSIPEEDAVLVHPEDLETVVIADLPIWQQDRLETISDDGTQDPDLNQETTVEDKMVYLKPQDNTKKRNSGSAWFKYKRLEKQPFVDDFDDDDELTYDCAQHIQRLLSASRENIEEARRILPDDVKDIVLPEDLEAALAEFDLWPDSSV